jgi:hypothetical protein
MTAEPNREESMPTVRTTRTRNWLIACAVAAALAPAASAQVGPDVTVYSISGVSSYGTDGIDRGYAIGTTSCNIGDVPVNWCDNSGGCAPLTWEQHPVIAQNMFRLKEGRFTQVGSSWLKHGFLSTNSNAGSSCTGPTGQQCTIPPLGGNQLGIGCTDTYGSSLNGSRPMGMPSEVNATTGVFPFPETVVPTDDVVDQRMRIAVTDLDPAQNAGAVYWTEAHYISDNDAMAGNGLNNASYRKASFGAAPDHVLSLTESTVREKWAVDAWAATQPGAELMQVAIGAPGGPEQVFHVGRVVTAPPAVGGATWHYEYFVHNMNSDRAARRLLIDFADGATISGVGFRDIDHHSGEYEPGTGFPYSTTDWGSTVEPLDGSVSWQTDLFDVAPNANALRWSTLYNFWFDADVGPDQIDFHELTLFRPGTPCRVAFSFSPEFVFADDFETGDLCLWSDPVTGIP